MPALDSVTGILAVPLWWAGGVAAVILVLLVLAVFRSGAAAVNAITRVSMLVIGVVAGWLYFDLSDAHQKVLERGALETRAAQLAGQANVPGSALACLAVPLGEAVENACEKAVFANPETVAAAIAYTGARLALLAESTAYARSRDVGHEANLGALRRGLEHDRYGILAHVFAARENCGALQCDDAAALRDRARVEANMKAKLFAELVRRHEPLWGARAAPANDVVAETTPTAPALGTIAPSSRYNFPSAASIPPVSIMNAEPGTPGAPSAAPEAPANAAPRSAPARRRSGQSSSRPPTSRAEPLPLQAS
ncbi:MAG: hypothetical protein HY056_00870, partial [Proteobacteria bacterium]|nr:hypothetical protein [Pseudomonadota bacterium]